jgi:polysaccharide export outer membrane protein
LPDESLAQNGGERGAEGRAARAISRGASTASLRELWEVVRRRRRLAGAVLGGLMLACLLYCLIAPNQYEATARVALRTTPDSSLNLEGQEAMVSASILSAPLQLETLAGELRSEQLAWRVIEELKLYQAPGFAGSFVEKFPGFKADEPAADAQEWLLERFEKRLNVQTVPRTLLIHIRFRSRDAALSAAVVNTLIHAYGQQDSESQVAATLEASDWLHSQLASLKIRVDQDQQKLTAFQNAHGMLRTPDTLASGQMGETEHSATLLEIDELGKQLVAATTDRILREAEYRAASAGDPELVIASDPKLQNADGNFATLLLEQIHATRSQLEQEQAQLSAEHGPNFPRVVEIRKQLQDLDRQKQAEDAKLVDRFRSAWQTAADQEQLVRKSLEATTSEGMKMNEAATEYAVMRQEADSSHDLYMRVLEKVQEAGLAAGIHGSNLAVVDAARQPVKPVAPDLPLYLAITFFLGLWLAVGAALMAESMGWAGMRTAAAVLAMLLAGAMAQAQAPTPDLEGIPTGVARIPYTQDNRTVPNAREAPAVWGNAAGTNQAGALPGTAQASTPMPAPIGPGDLLEVSEYHTPEFHSSVRVAADGTVALPMVNGVEVGGMDEQAAAHAIEAALVARGMLLHPQVQVLVLAYAGQDVSVLGEVTRPGVYPYTLHHRLLDLISAAAGTSATAGRLVNIYHRNDAKTPHPVVLDPGGTDKSAADHNPELQPGDTVQVSRAGLVYVVGDVVRPGGFAVDPAQGLTVVQALSLAWGPSQNAATGKALLIREQNGGRTMTTLNLRRMLHGQEPDQPVRDRDILYVPDSMAKNLMNRGMEAAIQSAIGVSIYSGLVYSQRY